jgi:hypothetical protein
MPMPARPELVETLVEPRTLLEGGFLTVRKDTVRLPDGATATREYIVHPGAVAVVPLLDEARAVLVRQYRYPLQQLLLEFDEQRVVMDDMATEIAHLAVLDALRRDRARRRPDLLAGGRIEQIVNHDIAETGRRKQHVETAHEWLERIGPDLREIELGHLETAHEIGIVPVDDADPAYRRDGGHVQIKIGRIAQLFLDRLIEHGSVLYRAAP